MADQPPVLLLNCLTEPDAQDLANGLRQTAHGMAWLLLHFVFLGGKGGKDSPSKGDSELVEAPAGDTPI